MRRSLYPSSPGWGERILSRPDILLKLFLIFLICVLIIGLAVMGQSDKGVGGLKC